MADEPDKGGNGGRTFVIVTNQDIYNEVQAMRNEMRDLAKNVSDYPETKSRVRALELKFYVIGAGLLAAIGVVIMRGGLPT